MMLLGWRSSKLIRIRLNRRRPPFSPPVLAKPGRSRAFSGGAAGRRWRRKGAGIQSSYRLGLLPVCPSGDQDPARWIRILRFSLFLPLLLWSELERVEPLAARLNNPSLLLLLLRLPLSPYFPLFGRGGVGRRFGAAVAYGSGGGGGLAASMCERGASQRSVVPSPPTSPLPACLGGEGKRG
jgi:hypothetical protein